MTAWTLDDQERSDRAAAARQHARFAAELAAHGLLQGRVALARQQLRDAIALLDEADAIERGEQ